MDHVCLPVLFVRLTQVWLNDKSEGSLIQEGPKQNSEFSALNSELVVVD